MPIKRIAKRATTKNATKAVWPTIVGNVYLYAGMFLGLLICRYFVEYYDGVWPDKSILGAVKEHIAKLGGAGGLAAGIIFLRSWLRDRKRDS